MTNDDDAVWRGLQNIALFLLFLMVATAVRGFVLSELWGWFVVPLGVGELGVAHAIGFALVVGYLTYQPDAKSESEVEGTFGVRLVTSLLNVIIPGAMVWGAGGVIHLMM